MLPNESMCINCILHMGLSDLQGVYLMHFVSFLNDFCPCILSFVLCINYNIFHPLWDQYTDSIVPPPMCLFGAVSEFVKSDLSELSVTFCQYIM